MADQNSFLIYQDDNGVSNVNVRFEGEDVWLTAEQLQTLFQTTQQNVSLHINNIYEDGELDENRTHKKYLLVRNEGVRSVRRSISHYNLDMILAVGMRIRSDVAVRFRRNDPVRERLRPRRSRADRSRRIKGMSHMSKQETVKIFGGKEVPSRHLACRRHVRGREVWRHDVKG